ncbi:DUF4274 domain-containing protein [Pseudomonas alabamensis]|uniref:DUF4274 domain-containing protein n=1 Tax=Pseudomonas alabamensis TaxID=3064349 RepID=UPI00295498E1|nr:DUF4274 domain-containing protein [Pseudomonas entomophila]
MDWQIFHEHLAATTPWERHVYAKVSNYSDNPLGLKWLLDKPSLELATALTLYWNLDAA